VWQRAKAPTTFRKRLTG